MDQYLLILVANWVESYEHPGGKRDVHDPKSREQTFRFEASDPEAARQEALQHIREFWEELPKKREGHLGWQDKDPEIRSVIFARIEPLEWKTHLQP